MMRGGETLHPWRRWKYQKRKRQSTATLAQLERSIAWTERGAAASQEGQEGTTAWDEIEAADE